MKKVALIKPEGGICSQIAFYALYKHLESLDYEVKFDFTWYKEIGKDTDGIHPRNWDFDKAFPTLKYNVASTEEIKHFKHNFNVGTNWLQLFPRMYIEGCCERISLMPQYKEFFIQSFEPVNKIEIADLCLDIQSQFSCGVHIRRGDLANWHPLYGEPLEPEYFIKAISKLKFKHKDIKFYFFSDEINYVKEIIEPLIPKNIDYLIIDQNDSTKGYLDLYMLSKCDVIVSSRGSMAGFAQFLSRTAVLIVSKK